jgi:hypothetical protein
VTADIQRSNYRAPAYNDRAAFAPLWRFLVFTHKHYLPVLKSKKGEFWALGHLSIEACGLITPILEVLPHKKENFDDHIASVLKMMGMAWPGQRFFLDTHYVNHNAPEHVALKRAIDCARHRQLMAVPATTLNSDPQVRAVLKCILEKDARGLLVRIRASEMEDVGAFSKNLQSFMNSLSIGPQEVDILLDYTLYSRFSIVQRTRRDLINLPYVQEWRSVTISAGAFPDKVPDEAKHKWVCVSRDDWKPWFEVVTAKQPLIRKPAFSDYGIRDPGPPAEGGRGSANLRYTTADHYIMKKGGPVAEGNAVDMIPITQSLLARPDFSGEKFSAGDKEIAKVARQVSSTGGSTEWTQWAMNHHLEFVAHQLSTHSEL